MTLIVARINEKQICIVSDTKLTHPNQEIKHNKTAPKDGAIKTTFINDRIAISIAGAVEDGEFAIKTAAKCKTLQDLFATLYMHHKKSKEIVEFIIATCYPNPQLTVIKRGKLETNQSVCWIGDTNGFSKFQKYSLSPVKETAEASPPKGQDSHPSQPGIQLETMTLNAEVKIDPVFSQMCAAMDSVIADGTIESVGGFKVCVIFDRRFYFNPYIKIYRSNVFLPVTGMGKPITHGTAGDGSSRIRRCVHEQELSLSILLC